MASYRSISELTPETAAYIAGLIDGEGTITLTRSHANRNRQLAVCIANTELPMLKFVLLKIGAGKITRKRAACERHTPSFCYAIANRQAAVGQVPGAYTEKRQIFRRTQGRA